MVIAIVGRWERVGIVCCIRIGKGVLLAASATC